MWKTWKKVKGGDTCGVYKKTVLQKKSQNTGLQKIKQMCKVMKSKTTILVHLAPITSIDIEQSFFAKKLFCSIEGRL